jgi:hypothetical protein
MVADTDPFQTERPVIFSLKQVGDATADFSEKRKIGEGGYGSVYLGFIGAHVRHVCTVSCRTTKRSLCVTSLVGNCNQEDESKQIEGILR